MFTRVPNFVSFMYFLLNSKTDKQIAYANCYSSSHEQFLWVVEFYNRQQISEFWRNCWKSSWPQANEMQDAWFKSCAGVAFPSIREWAWFSPCQETREKCEKPCNIDPKTPMKILFHCPPTFLSSNPKILKAFLKPFSTKLKSTKWPAKEKKEARNWNY